MKTNTLCVGAVALVMISMAMISAPAQGKYNEDNGDRPDDTGIFDYNQNVQFSEIVVDEFGAEWGVQYDGTLFELGTFVNLTYDTTWEATKGPSLVTADWSDDLILHQWREGQKVRTEVVLRLPDIATSAYTIRAHFAIEQINLDTGAIIEEIYNGTAWEGLYADGPTDAYTAEINQVGQLLYGYNWDTKRDAGTAGYYRLTFSIDEVSDVDLLAAFPYTIGEWCDVTITDVADYTYVSDGSAFTLGMSNTLSSTSIIVQLL